MSPGASMAEGHTMMSGPKLAACWNTCVRVVTRFGPGGLCECGECWATKHARTAARTMLATGCCAAPKPQPSSTRGAAQWSARHLPKVDVKADREADAPKVEVDGHDACQRHTAHGGVGWGVSGARRAHCDDAGWWREGARTELAGVDLFLSSAGRVAGVVRRPQHGEELRVARHHLRHAPTRRDREACAHGVSSRRAA